MALTVLHIAYPFAPVGPGAVGGAEQVLYQLDRALETSGHHSIVVACEGSTTQGMLVPVPVPNGPLDHAAQTRGIRRMRETIAKVLADIRVDLVHMHGVDFYRYLPAPGVPVLVTLHLPPSFYPEEVFYPSRPKTWLHCVSLSQRLACPPGAILLPDVENGVDIDGLQTHHARRDFALALGRICPEKGFHHALEACRRIDYPLLLAGQVFPYETHQHYFDDEIRPRLDTRRRFIGPVGFDRKRRLLAAARCLVVPSLVAETSSLVAMEALACGTPVVAFPSGALADIIEHGRTGFLVRDETEMAEAILRTREIDPEACRQTARRRFSAQNTITNYFALYQRLLSGDVRTRHPRMPVRREYHAG